VLPSALRAFETSSLPPLVQVCAAGAPPCVRSVRAEGLGYAPGWFCSRFLSLYSIPLCPGPRRLVVRSVCASIPNIPSSTVARCGGLCLARRRGRRWLARSSRGPRRRRRVSGRKSISARSRTTRSHVHSSAASVLARGWYRRVAGAGGGVARGPSAGTPAHPVGYAGVYRLRLGHRCGRSVGTLGGTRLSRVQLTAWGAGRSVHSLRAGRGPWPTRAGAGCRSRGGRVRPVCSPRRRPRRASAVGAPGRGRRWPWQPGSGVRVWSFFHRASRLRHRSGCARWGRGGFGGPAAGSLGSCSRYKPVAEYISYT
jgi:hypothetical protein